MTAPAIEAAEPHPDDEHDPADAAEQGPPLDPSGLDGGWFLTHPNETEVRQHVLDQWKAQRAYQKLRRAKESRWERLRSGERGLMVVDTDEDVIVRRDFGDDVAVVGNNTLDQLIRRMAAVLTTDPPLPTVTPASDTDKERQASELAERILRVEGSAVNRDDAGTRRMLIDLAGTYGSAFVYHYVNPQGDGLQPVEIQAHPMATNVTDALTPMGPPTIDPMTGAEVPGLPIPITVSDLITRYVRVDNTLTDVQAEAKMAPQSATQERVIRPAQVCLLPFGVDAFEAQGVLVGEILPLYEVVARFYDGVRPDEETVKKLTAWKPGELGYEHWTPKALRSTMRNQTLTRPGNGADAVIADDAPCAVVCAYMISGPMANLGAYMVITGVPDKLAKREPWKATVGEGDDARTVFLPLPVVQLRWREDADGDPLGVPGTEDLAPASNIAHTFLEYLLSHCYIASNRHVFLPMGGAVQPDQLNRRDGTPINILPNAQPFYEEVPALEALVGEMYKGSQDELEKVSGLNSAAATGEAPASVNSGTQLAQLVEETRVGLTGNIQNADRFDVQNWDVRLEFIRAFTTTPKMLTYSGESGDVQQRAFMGAELLHYGDIQIAKDSSTMLTRSAKAQLLQNGLDLALKTGDAEGVQRYKDNLAANQNPLLGMQDDPIRSRMQRQIADWKQGARKVSDTTAPASSTGDVGGGGSLPAVGAPMSAPQGEPQPLPDPADAEAAQCFAPNPTDELPSVAPIRFLMLRDLVASKAFTSAPPPYQRAAGAEYERMRQAAGIMTRAEQQMQAQQAAQQQAMAQQQQGAAQHAQKQEQSAQSHAQAMEQQAAKAPPQAPPIAPPPPGMMPA